MFNFSAACCRSGRSMRWTDEGRRRWMDVLAGTPDAAVPAAFAAAVPSPPSGAEPPGELPAELSYFTKALRLTMPATRLGAMFRPDTPGRHVLLDNRVAAWTPVDEAAQRAIDAELRAWFAAAHAGVPREEGDVFVVPACFDDACDWGVDDPYVRARAVRRHAACSTKTTRPWAFLRAMRAHAALRREEAARGGGPV